MKTISVRGLLAIYVAIPAVLLFMLADRFLFGGVAQKFLPQTPEQLLWYMLLFNFPHIFASYFSFADKEYFSYYRKKLLVGIPLIVLAGMLLAWQSTELCVLILIGYTFYHNVSQQTGITTILMRYRDRMVTVWRFVNIALAIFLYVLIYPSLWRSAAWEYAYPVGLTLLACSIVLTVLMTKHAQTREGKLYAWGTTSIAGVGLIGVALGYPIFAISLLRVVHDITAFVFYIVHDMNRNREVAHNLLYRYVIPSTSMLVFMIPLFGVFLTYVVQGGGTATVLPVFFILAVTHFYIEGFMWKNGSPHRANIAFST